MLITVAMVLMAILIWEVANETIEEDETTMSQMRSRSKEN